MVTKEEFKHNTELSWTDISTEEYRVYEFPEKNIQIDQPLLLSVSKSGGHRLFDAQGISHYIPNGYCHLFWKAKENQPHFVR